MREGVEAKGRRLLVEGRLDVEARVPTLARVRVRGDTGVVHVAEWHRGDAWTCTCPARGRCSHITAAMLIIITDTD